MLASEARILADDIASELAYAGVRVNIGAKLGAANWETFSELAARPSRRWISPRRATSKTGTSRVVLRGGVRRYSDSPWPRRISSASSLR